MELQRILGIILTGVVSTGFAQESGWPGVVGNWKLEYQDKARGKVVGCANITPGKLNGEFPGIKNGFFINSKVETVGKRMMGSFAPYMNSVKFDLTRIGENQFTGFWKERGDGSKGPKFSGTRKYDNPDGRGWYWEIGTATWTRVLPAVTNHKVLPVANGALKFKEMKHQWKYAAVNANLPKIALDLYGEGMPLSQKKYTYIELVTHDPKLRHNGSSFDREKGALRLEFWLTEGVSPGTKRITLNGVDILWDLEFEGYEEPKLKELRFLHESKEEPLVQVADNQPFRLEAVYTGEPYGDQRTIQLDWSDKRKAVTAYRSEERTRYRSKPVTLKPRSSE